MSETTPTHAKPTPQGQAQPLRRMARPHLKGRQVDEQALALVRALIPLGLHRRDLLIEHLHVLNDHSHGLYESHLVALAHAMRLPMVEVFEVASFYHHFAILKDGTPAPTTTLRVCDGLSCRMAGSASLMTLAHKLARDANGRIEVQAVPCIGRCEQAPAASVNQRAVPHADEGKFQAALADPGGVAWVGQSAPEVTRRAAYEAQGGYALLRALASDPERGEALLQTLTDSGLRGLGGAGFPAGRKWQIVRAYAAPRLMAVNIDEGEPGTFKDRYYLERDPHRFLEGMLIAAHVVGIAGIYIYIRDEYRHAHAVLAEALAELQNHPPVALPPIEIRRGAGAYICGEESAMIESIEGQRGEPRMRPPYIAEQGLFGRPTLEHNFETLYWVREIAERGAAWFASQGRHGRHGLRSYSVSGRVRQPGVKLAPAGITLRELIDEYCGGMAEGHTLYAYLPGGASGGILPARLADLPLDFDTLQPHGAFIGSAAVIVLSQHDRARDAAQAMMDFFADESCGQCTPCRVGTRKASILMQAKVWDAATLNDLNQVMQDASICGLGQAAPNPVRHVLEHFAHEVGADQGVKA